MAAVHLGLRHGERLRAVRLDFCGEGTHTVYGAEAAFKDFYEDSDALEGLEAFLQKRDPTFR